MDQYEIGAVIKKRREEKKMTQMELAEILNVSDKTVSKWETAKGYPDITLVEPLAKALGISVMELMSGNDVQNKNRAWNMMKMKLYVCPICGNVISSIGEAVISCCGITLPPLEAESPDESHSARIEKVEDEYAVTISHEMSKEHFISFLVSVSDHGAHMIKLYPEGAAEARFPIRRTRRLYYYCNRHGLFQVKIK